MDGPVKSAIITSTGTSIIIISTGTNITNTSIIIPISIIIIKTERTEPCVYFTDPFHLSYA